VGYRFLADALVALHLVWILFMLAGFVLVLWGVLFKRSLLNWFWFRTFHLIGIIYVAALSIQEKLCPLTVWENLLRNKAEPTAAYSGSFIIHYIEKLVYPEIDPVLLQAATLFLGVISVLAYLLFPPHKLRNFLKR
jgi:hypothetical protein